MATNQNQNPTWMMNRNWQVVMANPVNNSLSDSIIMTDTLVFTSQGTIEFTHNFPQTTNVPLSSLPSPQIWGTWDLSSANSNSLKGTTSSGTPFHVDYAGGQVQCFLDSPQVPRRGWALALGVFAGALTGGAVGAAARAPFVGALAGLAAGTSAAFTVALIKGVYSTQGGPNATWVANDGGAGVPKPKPQEAPQTLKAVSA
ncbi:MAG TPA: hypothetical protein VLB76_17325 [Thermoanaerobaculia bacterium]|jgi:hypothetical protein|nr:hypothetical protein [Thermoanaerobaculia bacterium]